MVLVDIETNARQLRGKLEVGDLVKHVEPTCLEDGLWAPLSFIYIERESGWRKSCQSNCLHEVAM